MSLLPGFMCSCDSFVGCNAFRSQGLSCSIAPGYLATASFWVLRSYFFHEVSNRKLGVLPIRHLNGTSPNVMGKRLLFDLNLQNPLNIFGYLDMHLLKIPRKYRVLDCFLMLIVKCPLCSRP